MLTSRLLLHPLAELILGYHDAAADADSREIFLCHEFVGTGSSNTQGLSYELRVEEQRELVVVGERRFLHL